jgi:hypothetical protein
MKRTRVPEGACRIRVSTGRPEPSPSRQPGSREWVILARDEQIVCFWAPFSFALLFRCSAKQDDASRVSSDDASRVSSDDASRVSSDDASRVSSDDASRVSLFDSCLFLMCKHEDVLMYVDIYIFAHVRKYLYFQVFVHRRHACGTYSHTLLVSCMSIAHVFFSVYLHVTYDICVTTF